MGKPIIAIALTAFAGIAGVQAQTYPSRQLPIVAPFPSGGSTDVVRRIMAEKMRIAWPAGHHRKRRRRGRQHRGRARRACGARRLHDRHRPVDTHVGSIIYPLNYDLQKDFEPIGLISVNPQLMVAKKALPADDLKGLVAWMKENSGKITFVNQKAAAKLLALDELIE